MSLITDFDDLETDKIRRIRDQLIEKMDFANNNYPKTDSKAYKEAQKAIKQEEEQSFKKGEIDKLLPKRNK